MRIRVEALVERAQKTLPARVLTAYGESQASNYALALAFTGLMSMFPMIVGALAIIGLALRDPTTQAHFQALVVQAFPLTARPEIVKALQGLKDSAGWLGLVSLIGVIWAASGVFGTMEFALTQIFGTRQRDLLRQRLMGLAMMAVLIVALVVMVGANAIAALIPVAGVGPITSLLVGSAVMGLLLIALYRFVPNRTFRLGDVVPGAVVAGVGIELLTLVAFPIYVRIAGGFNTYGAQFGLFFLLATWFYLLSQLILIGAVLNKFRLGEPDAHGLFASPMSQSRDMARPVDAIEQKKAESTPPEPPRRSVFQRVALGVVVGVGVAASVFRRRRPRTIN